MAIDFSQVKSLTIPEGSVTKITDSTGNILWKKDLSWHTLWEGSVTLRNSASSKEVATLDALSGTVTLRVTWSSTASGGNYYDTKYYNNNGSTTTFTKPDSPFQFDLNTASSRDYIVGCTKLKYNSIGVVGNTGRIGYLSWDHIHKTFNLHGDVGTDGTYDPNGTEVNLSVTITKIEQYS